MSSKMLRTPAVTLAATALAVFWGPPASAGGSPWLPAPGGGSVESVVRRSERYRVLPWLHEASNPGRRRDPSPADGVG